MRRIAVVTLVLAAAAVPAAAARHRSLYSGPGSRPGPAILYSRAAVAPQLTNRAPWRARPVLVSGATAYRSGEFLYQDFLYDDHGAHVTPDPADARAQGDTFSKPNGTYTYPSDVRYAANAADLVELRVRPARRSTAFRVTLNTLEDPSLVAFSVAIGGTAGRKYAFPSGANVRAPAALFLTVHPVGARLVADLVRAKTGRRVGGRAPRVRLDRRRRQIVVSVSHRQWNPRRRTVRLAAGVGLWDRAGARYLLPQATADATRPGGAGAAAHPAAFFNVAFRTHEPFPAVTDGPTAITDGAWWRDRAQGAALARGDLSPLFARVSFAKLARRVRDDRGVPRKGPIDRILPSHFEPAQGAQFASQCGFQGATKASTCVPEYQGRLQPYAIYVPRSRRPARGYGMTLLLHSLSANYNQYLGSRNQSQFGERPASSIVITPESRGPDQFYEGLGSADVFEVWADVARRYRLDPAYTEIAGYSMGGIGTFKLGAQFPDLFARAQPTVGDESNNDVLASLRNVPVLMWNNSGDELVNAAIYSQTAMRLNTLGYRYELDVFEPCANAKCSPLFPNHLELAVNDQYAPAAAFLGTAKVDRDPAHVTYVADAARDRPALGITGDHAYWVSGVKLRSLSHTSTTGDPQAQVDAVSHGFGVGDPPVAGGGPLSVLGTQLGTGTLTGGNLGPLEFSRFAKSWGATPSTPRQNTIDVKATNVAAGTIDPGRAHVDCHAAVRITTDGPIAVTLRGCGRVVRAG